jgi:hypothetical protein
MIHGPQEARRIKLSCLQQIKREILKQFILPVFFFSFVISGFGQKNIRLSFTGSPAVNWMVTNNAVVGNGNPTFGYDFGLEGNFYFTEDERYSLLTGILITNTGGELSYHNNSDFTFSRETLPGASTIRYQLRYVEIPLSIKLKTGLFHRIAYWGQLGLTTMVNIDAKGSSDNGVLNTSNINDEINLFNLDMNVGFGIDFDLSGNNSITSGVIFQNGLIDVTTNNTFTDKSIINSLKLKIGLNF